MKRLGRMAIVLGIAASSVSSIQAPAAAAPCVTTNPIGNVQVHVCVLVNEDPPYAQVAWHNYQDDYDVVSVTVDDEVTVCEGWEGLGCYAIPNPLS